MRSRAILEDSIFVCIYFIWIKDKKYNHFRLVNFAIEAYNIYKANKLYKLFFCWSIFIYLVNPSLVQIDQKDEVISEYG